MCSMSRAPRREECAICTARAPEAVTTVRMYGDTGPPYGPRSPALGAQIHAPSATKKQVSEPTTFKISDGEPSRAAKHLDTAATALDRSDTSGAYQLAYDALRKSAAVLLTI